MSSGFRHKAAAMSGLSLLCSMVLAGWTQLNSGTTADLYAVHFPAGTQIGYAVGATGTIRKTTDGGNNWAPESSGTTNGLKSVYFKEESTGFAVGERGTALKTTDGGATWTTMTVPGSDVLNHVQFPDNDTVGYIGVYRVSGARVLKTTNGGGDWTAVSVGGPMSSSRSCGFATDDVGVVVGNGGFVYATTDGCSTFTAQGSQTIADIVDAAFSPADPNMGYLIGDDPSQGVVRYTATGGFPLWDSVTCPVITAFYGVDMPDSEVAYICGTDGFIGKTVSPTEVGWTQVPSGFTATVRGLCFPVGADTGYAVGAGGAILVTYDGGEFPQWVTEGKEPSMGRAGIRVASNPSRYGITFHADADASVVVLDAAGRVVKSQAATKGLNFLPVPKAGVYFVREEAQGANLKPQVVRKVVVTR